MKLYRVSFFDSIDWLRKDIEVIAENKESLMTFLKKEYYTLSDESEILEKDKALKIIEGSFEIPYILKEYGEI